NYSHGSNSATQTVQGTYNIAHIQRALGPLSQCTGPCVPLNLFGGPGTITPAMLAYIGYIEHDSSANDIELYSANLNGALFSLPAGEVKFATGLESRRYSGSYQPDAVVVAGESNGVPRCQPRARTTSMSSISKPTRRCWPTSRSSKR
ncbi:TonB-dependent receptor, partial [mine drainage metagenome]